MRSGYYKETIVQHINLTDSGLQRAWIVIGLALALAAPFVLGYYGLSIVTLMAITAIGAMGLNILTGWTGLISLGQTAFMVLGAYAYAIATESWGWPPLAGFALAGVVPALASVLVGVPSLRLTGLYLAITTLASAFIVNHMVLEFDGLTNGSSGIFVNRPKILGYAFDSDTSFYYLCVGAGVLTILACLNLRRSRIGRAFIAIRDNDNAARVMGIDLRAYKLYAFMASSFIVGLSGALYGIFLSFVTVDGFPFLLAIEALAILIVGGMGSIAGAILGSIFLVGLPEVTSFVFSLLGERAQDVLSTSAHEIKGLLYGLVIILFLRLKPHGLMGLWQDARRAWTLWPLRY
ncbi:branched-chain amino acid ABC transporter permease [Seohaeicola zhoushanensis]|uniref:Branched-chain amino acid ABC transporter permease n=1 Tax=Seohaeicola zhoushanensis TaxID=1569283 RepID=A0A8J3MAC0_9RHOB|nr:branched-chain amino acid ABC transporter permease [Seohaeicola zhoushanensis]GHF76298.1 branched-chain amino acid ABC transporter permease [Seohaeicola zhoushanensis]